MSARALLLFVVSVIPAAHAGLSIVPGPSSPAGAILGGGLDEGGLAGCYHESGGPPFADHVSVNFHPGAVRDGGCNTECGITMCLNLVCSAGLPGSWVEQVRSIDGTDTCTVAQHGGGGCASGACGATAPGDTDGDTGPDPGTGSFP